MAASYNNLGVVNNKLGDFEKAKEYHQLALSIRQKKLGPENVQVAASYNHRCTQNRAYCLTEITAFFHRYTLFL